MKTEFSILEITAGFAVFNLLLAVVVTVYQAFSRKKHETPKRITEFRRH
jgi:hypothetical protein